MINEIYKVGGARVGLFNASWPFANLSVNNEEIVLSMLSKKYKIEKDKLNALKKHKGLFSTGLKIEHCKNNVPEHLIFWVFGFSKLKLALEEMGYEVDD